MKKILIPTDFSSNAGDALAYALDFIGDSMAELHIVHVVNTSTVVGDAPAATAEMIRVQLDHANESMKALEVFGNSSDNPNVVVSTKVLAGPTSPSIKNEAKEFEADLIIMGTRGDQHDRMDKWLGSVSSNVIDEAPCPVILVPHDYKFKTIDNVIFSTNINHNDPYELWRGMQVLSPHTAIVQALHVTQGDDEVATKELENFASYMVEATPSIQTIFSIEKGKNIEETIENYAENHDAEMIIMHRIKRNFWGSLFGKSHTKKMTSFIRIPLMVLN